MLGAGKEILRVRRSKSSKNSDKRGRGGGSEEERGNHEDADTPVVLYSVSNFLEEALHQEEAVWKINEGLHTAPVKGV